MAVITLNPGEVLTVVFAETDGMFHIHFDTEKFPDAVAVEEAAGLPGNVCGERDSVLYHDRFQRPDAEDVDCIEAVDDEQPYSGHSENLKRIKFDNRGIQSLACAAFAWPMNNEHLPQAYAARKFLGTMIPQEAIASVQPMPNDDPTCVTRLTLNTTKSQAEEWMTSVLGAPLCANLQSTRWLLAPRCTISLTQHTIPGPYGDAFLAVELRITTKLKHVAPTSIAVDAKLEAAFRLPMNDPQRARNYLHTILPDSVDGSLIVMPDDSLDRVTRFVSNLPYAELQDALSHTLGGTGAWLNKSDSRSEVQEDAWTLVPGLLLIATNSVPPTIALHNLGEDQTYVPCVTRAPYTMSDHVDVLSDIELPRHSLGVARNKLARDAFMYPLDTDHVKRFLEKLIEAPLSAPFEVRITSMAFLLDNVARSNMAIISSVRGALGDGTKIPYGYVWEVARGCTVYVGPGPGEFSTDRVIRLSIPEIDDEDEQE